LIGVEHRANAAVQLSFLSNISWSNDLVAMFIVMEVCKKKTINPTLFKKKGANAPL
jgi:hypothetical protein|tara:strand:- start:110 stop:277 length:168 start_codon:yes stop_codon:yes gene_type:complete